MLQLFLLLPRKQVKKKINLKNSTQVDFGYKRSDSQTGANEYTEDAKATSFYDP